MKNFIVVALVCFFVLSCVQNADAFFGHRRRRAAVVAVPVAAVQPVAFAPAAVVVPQRTFVRANTFAAPVSTVGVSVAAPAFSFQQNVGFSNVGFAQPVFAQPAFAQPVFAQPAFAPVRSFRRCGF